jgi:hypothetical protein
LIVCFTPALTSVVTPAHTHRCGTLPIGPFRGIWPSEPQGHDVIVVESEFVAHLLTFLVRKDGGAGNTGYLATLQFASDERAFPARLAACQALVTEMNSR